MIFDSVKANSDNSQGAKKACELFTAELNDRHISNSGNTTLFVNFVCESASEVDSNDRFFVKQDNLTLLFSAQSVRGLIFAYSLFLRKLAVNGNAFTLLCDISGEYCPDKKIRGHQIGYRTTPNTYDAWDTKQYFRYYLDMMAFGANTCEHIPYEKGVSKRNRLMRYDEEELLREACELADSVDMNVSLWQPNCDGETESEAVARRDKLYSSLKRLDYLFIPSGDPGELPARDFVARCKLFSEVLKKSHPNAEMHPSAQAPHSIATWGKDFCDLLAEEPSEIDCVIMGPNHAYPMHDLRKKLPARYDMRFYPDITHNVRCEYPVHFLSDDWHFSFASTISREGVNPRPREFQKLHRLYSPYTVGSVSYSEGVHDDVNKAVWSALEFDRDMPLDEILQDYARYFMFGADYEKIADCIFALEDNWQADPLHSPSVKNTYTAFCELKADYPFLSKNWRFMLLYFRACCDMVVYLRRRFEESLCRQCRELLRNGEWENAAKCLEAPFSAEYDALQGELDVLAEKLFSLIGIQLDTEHYCADSWERGATLETIDNPVSDRGFLRRELQYLNSLPDGEKAAFSKRLLNRCNAGKDGIYFSVALHGLDALGVMQDGEFYMDYQGDRPSAKEKMLPMCMTKVYDHFSFKAKLGGFVSGKDYKLRITYKVSENEAVKHHTITANKTVIYDGVRYGGKRDEHFDREMLADGFETRTYALPASVFGNTTLDLTISEPLVGFCLCEFWIFPA